MRLPDWLSLALRIVVLVALVPGTLHAYRQVRGARPLSRTAGALLAAAALLLIGGFITLLFLP